VFLDSCVPNTHFYKILVFSNPLFSTYTHFLFMCFVSFLRFIFLHSKHTLIEENPKGLQLSICKTDRRVIKRAHGCTYYTSTNVHGE
jgi:hypothetical protein